MAESSRAGEPYVFLSYTSGERERALAVADAIGAAGITVWVDRRNLVGGSSWNASIVDAIANCTAFVLTCSARSLASPNVQQEVQLAWEEQRPILPLMLEQVAIPRELRYPLAGRQWVELLDRPAATWLPDVLRSLAGLGLTPTVARVTDASATAAAPEPRGNLPTPLTSFIGREQELREVTILLGTTRLLTLTGPGGTGKTRLALAVARRSADHFPDGVWFIDLSGVADSTGVIPAIAQTLDVRESEGRTLAVSLAAYLRRKQQLLVLDNFEQVVTAAMALYDLLAEAPGLTLLVTSRVLLRLAGEQEYAVPPLPLPEDQDAADPALLGQNPAVQLFLDRARGLRPDLAVTTSGEAMRAIAAICQRLDGLPLAIELAAAKVKLLPPVQLLARLERRLPLLTGGMRSLPARQQTLRATIQWSWDLLSEPECVLFRRLGVFAGSWSLEAAEAVCNPDGELDVLEGLASLVDQSLVRRQDDPSGAPRFRMLATLQEFALEQLAASGDEAALRREHATYYCVLSEAAEATYWRSGRVRQDLLQPSDPERYNLLAALSWAVAEQDAELGLRLGGALAVWFLVRSPGEGSRYYDRLLRVPGEGSDSARGRALRGAGVCAIARGDIPAAVALYEASVACLRVAEDLPSLSRSLAVLGAWLPDGEAELAHLLTEEALRLARSVGSAYEIGFVEVAHGQALLWHGGDRAIARAHLEEALRIGRSLDADWLTMFALGMLAQLEEAEGQYVRVTERLHEALGRALALGDQAFSAHNRPRLARAAAIAGNYDEAAAQWRTALLLARELESVSLAAHCLPGIAGLLSAQQHVKPAVRLLAASERLRPVAEQMEYGQSQFQAAYSDALHTTRTALSSEAFAKAWAAGQALTLDEAVALALASLPPGDMLSAPEPA